jgi:hypothetical protein
LDAPAAAAAAEADNADICTIQQKPSNAAIDGGGVSAEGWASSVGGLCPHTLHLDATINGVSSFVMFDGNFLLAVRQFSPPEAANSQFWLRSRTHKICPRPTTLPKPRGIGIIIAKSIPQGSILMNKMLDKIGEGGGFWFSPLWFLRFLFGSFECLCKLVSR